VPASRITPVTLLTGFLGSGKTTLLARVLADPAWRDSAVIVNEWGEAGLDHVLLRESRADVALVAGGCACCRVAGDLVRTLRELHAARLAGRASFDRVVIETTGLADPVPLIATLAGMPLAAARFALAGVVATVDAEHGEAQLRAHPEARSQVAVADRIVVTKVDRAAPAALEGLERAIRSLNPAAPCARASPGQPLEPSFLEAGLHRGAARAADATGWLHAGAYRRVGAPAAHAADIASFAWTAAEPFRPGDLEAALGTLVDAAGSCLLRLKGLASVEGESGPRAVHAVGHTLYPSARLAVWPEGARSSAIVLIGRGLEERPIASILDSFLRR
jgi:G3E family GTPase